ncbi:MAG: VTC domain-containing protein [Actinobacteria bacterium]|nr:VTC domain-containing protein [Actinomycetota bacterium]
MTLLVDHLANFQTIDLKSIDEGWLGKRRFDRKFLLTRTQLETFLNRNQNNCSVLEIAGIKSFEYCTEYFDTANLDCYLDHVKRRKRRAKIRFRKYLDTNHSRFEVKMKLGNLQTYKAALENSSEFGEHESAFAYKVLSEFIPNAQITSATHELVNTATNTFTRSTLLHLNARERITIDQNLAVAVDGQQKRLKSDLVLVEIKSITRSSSIVRGLLLSGIRPVRFSKYCASLDLLASPRPLVHTSRFLTTKFTD